MTEKTSVVLVDDHPVFRKGLRMLLEDEPDFSVIGEAGDGEEAIALIIEHQPDIAVLDISMPGISGIEVAKRISEACPDTRIVALSIHSEKRFVEDMLIAGAAGYILKQSAPEDLVSGIRTVINGESFLSPSITSVVLSGLRASTPNDSVDIEDIPVIISTKLNSAQLPENLVVRKDLVEKLKKGSRLPVVLVTAPAGYGKSVSVSSWLQQQPIPFGWISLDETENNLRQFLLYLVHAVQSLFPGKLTDTQTLVCSANLPPVHALAVSFLCEIEQIDQDFIIVLDNVHLVREKRVYDFLSELLRYPPHQLHFIIMGRRDPFLPIASLRGKRLLTELRTGELQFSLEETRDYLQLLLGEEENEKLTQMLHEKMEGWISGLRLAILSTDQTQGLEEMLQQLKGDSQYVQEYLFNEVLENLPSTLRSDIMNLAILDRFCGPLCEKVIRASDHGKDRDFSGWDFLKELKQSHMFLESLDTENIWYRFHRLFQNLLQKQLERSVSSEKIEELHKVASEWLVSNGFVEEGIKHAIRGQDFESAERIIQQHRHKELGRDRWNVVDKWLSMLPEEMILRRPSLILVYAWCCFARYRFQKIAALLERLESLSGEVSLESRLMAEYKFLKGLLSYWSGNSETCLLCMAEARNLLQDSSHQFMGYIETYVALAQQMQGNSLLAIEQLQAKILNVGITSAIYRSQLTATIGFVHFLEGKLYAAYESAERLLQMTRQNSQAYLETYGHYMRGNASLQLFDLDKAAYHFSALTTAKLYLMHTRVAVDVLSGLALTRFFQQDKQEAYRNSDKLCEFTRQTQDDQLIIIADSLKARLLIMDRLEVGAENCLQRVEFKTGHSALFFVLELPEITQIRVLISIGLSAELERAAELLAALKQCIIAQHNRCHLVDLLVLETLLLVKTEGADEALVQLEKAVALAAEDGWIRPFIEPGRPLMELLNRLEPATAPARRHLVAIQQSGSKPQMKAASPEDLPESILDEPLTSRESEILELLAQRLRNKEIGEKLFISPETVKSHIKKLFLKLDAVDRHDVVDKAIKLGLLKKY